DVLFRSAVAAAARDPLDDRGAAGGPVRPADAHPVPGLDQADPEGARRSGLMASRFMARKEIGTPPSWLTSSTSVTTRPRSGLERDRQSTTTVARRCTRSPGRSGTRQRSSATPGEARLATRDR